MTLPELELNDQFTEIIDILENKQQHVFITGRAGTGKSTLLTHFRNNTLRRHVVLAPTGVAALNVQGQTIHSFFRFFPNITVSEARKQAFKLKNSADLYKALELLIVDEISMVRADMLDCMDEFLRVMRKSSQPFGGVRLICFGDLYQLPPVVRGEELQALNQVYDTPYFFSSDVFRRLMMESGSVFQSIELEKVYRQTDQTFVELLNGIRDKTITSTQIEELNRQVIEGEMWDVIDNTSIILTATNAQAERINQAKLNELESKLMIFDATTKGKFDKNIFPTDEELKLKKGARVMMINNDPDGLWVNGSMGVIVDVSFSDILGENIIEVQLDAGELVEVLPNTWEMSKTYFDKESNAIERETIGKFRQYPLRLAWAMTIHKSQGKTFDQVVIDLGRGAFAAGQTYVALSRCRTIDGIQLCRPLKISDVQLDDQIVKFISSLKNLPESVTTQVSHTEVPLFEQDSIIL